MNTPPFDRVVVDRAGQRVNMTFDRFLELPLHQRVQHLMDRSTQFFFSDAPVERRMVLRALMKNDS